MSEKENNGNKTNKRLAHEALINHFLTHKGHINRKQTWDEFGTHVTCSCGKTFDVPFSEISPEEE